MAGNGEDVGRDGATARAAPAARRPRGAIGTRDGPWQLASQGLGLVAAELDDPAARVERTDAAVRRCERCASAARALGVPPLENALRAVARALQAASTTSTRPAGARERRAELYGALLSWLRDPSPAAARGVARELARPDRPFAMGVRDAGSLARALARVRLVDAPDAKSSREAARGRRRTERRALKADLGPRARDARPAAIDPELLAIARREVAGCARDFERAFVAASAGDAGAFADALRAAHTLKGAADATAMSSLAALAHRVEGLLAARVASGGAGARRTCGELERAATRLSALAAGAAGARRPAQHRSPLGPTALEAFRARLELTVGHACRASGKLASLSFAGAAAAPDERTLRALVAPLTQVLRNAVDHGIETPARRRRAGKPATGRIEVRFVRSDERVRVHCVDDGAGLDFDAIRAAAVARALIPASAAVGRAALARMIVEPGLTTRPGVGRLSGRGAGLGIAARAAARLGGTLEIAPRRGAGTRVTLSIPASGSRG